jgi:hypothetical protein
MAAFSASVGVRGIEVGATPERIVRTLLVMVLFVMMAGGGGGIRTHGRLPYTRFPSVPVRPLSHSSSYYMQLLFLLQTSKSHELKKHQHKTVSKTGCTG